MPFFSLRSIKSSPSINYQTSSSSNSSEDEMTKSKERASSFTHYGNTSQSSPKTSKLSPNTPTSKKREEPEDEEHVIIEPTPLHPYLQSPRRSSRTSSLKANTPPHTLNYSQPSPPKLSSSFSPTNKYISNLHQYSRKRSNSMDATELAKTLDVYNAMKARQQLEEDRRKLLLSSELDSSSTPTNSSSTFNNSLTFRGSADCSNHSPSTSLNASSLLHFEASPLSFSDQSSDEEKQNSLSGGSVSDEEPLSPNNQYSDDGSTTSSSPYTSEDESKKISLSGAGSVFPPQQVNVDLNNISRKEFKKLPHLRKRVARNSLKTQLEMSKEKEAIELEKEAKKL